MSLQKNPLSIYRIKITLKDAEPAIWRRFLVPSHITLHRLHLILQEVMGWTNSHLYRFEIDNKEYGVLYTDDEFDEFDFIDSKKAKLNHLITTKGDAFVYEYDFGDGWTHDVVLEDISEPIPGNIYPVCLEGERTCPPEDCGGLHGYSTLLGIIANPDNEEYEEMITWLGGSFRPDVFNIVKVNRRLKPIQLR